jgi:hypothetical protein
MRAVLDEDTKARLAYQWRRLQLALHGDEQHIPDRKEAALIYRRINDILDYRIRPVEIRPDGSPVWPDAVSPWIADQINVGLSIAVNTTGEAERVVTAQNIRDAVAETKARMDANTPEENS